MNVFDMSAKIALDINGYLKGMNTAEATAISVTSVIGQKISTFMNDSINVGKNFSTSMSQVGATLGKTVEDLGENVQTVDTQFGEFTGTLREFAQYMGENTVFSANQCAQALNYMALAGYDAKESMEMLPNVLNLAAAGHMDLARASDVVTDVQTAFGISANRTKKMVDEMAKAASTGNTNVEQLGEAFLRVGPLARNLNDGYVKLADGSTVVADGTQELETAFVAMANAGIKGSEAGTHMRNMIMKLSNPTKEGKEKLDEMGISAFDAAGKMLPLSQIFSNMSEAMRKMTQQERMEAIGELFNARDLASAESLLSAISGDWDNIGSAIQDAAGAAEQMAETQLDNLAGDTTLFNSALEGLQIKISDSVMPVMRKFTQMGTDGIGLLTDAFGSLSDEAQSFVGIMMWGIGQVSSALPGIVSILGSIGQMKAGGLLGGAAGEVGALGAGLGTLATVVLPVAATVTAVGVAAGYTYYKFKDLTEESQNYADRAKEIREETEKDMKEISEWKGKLGDVTDYQDKAARAAEIYNKKLEVQTNVLKWRKEAFDRWDVASETHLIKGVSNAISENLVVKPGGVSGGDGLKVIADFFVGIAGGIKDQANTMNEYQDYVAISEEINKDVQIAARNAAVYNSAALDMTDTQRDLTIALLDKVEAVNIDADTIMHYTTCLDALNTSHYNAQMTAEATIQAIDENIKELDKAYEENYQACKESLDGQSGLYSKLELDTETSIGDIMKNMQSQEKYFAEYEENLEWMIGQKFPLALQQYLATGSEEAVNVIHMLKNASEEDVEKFVSQWDKTEQIKIKLAGTMDDAQLDYNRTVDELNQKKDETMEAMAVEEEAYTTAINNMTAFMTGIEDQQDEMAIITDRVTTNAIDAMNTYDKMAAEAKKGIEGLTTVWSSYNTLRELYKLGYNAGKKVQEGYSDADDSHSPSRVYQQFGKYAMDGLVLGVKNNIDEVTSAYSMAAKAAQDAYDTTLETPAFQVYDNPEYQKNDDSDSKIVFAGDIKIEISGVDGKTADEIVDVIEERIYENARKEQLGYGLA